MLLSIDGIRRYYIYIVPYIVRISKHGVMHNLPAHRLAIMTHIRFAAAIVRSRAADGVCLRPAGDDVGAALFVYGHILCSGCPCFRSAKDAGVHLATHSGEIINCGATL